MVNELAQQVVEILKNSEKRALKISRIIVQLKNFDPASNDDKVVLASALDILSDKGQIQIEHPPAYLKSLDGFVSFNDKVITLEETE